ncbi:hypothetical protein NPIL_302601 [Nephila pilipes]|uniref:Uncharacterized protein n=1 Tax=Nephila pilipes TaxID=299642 RepID=A0A8X6Q9X3_NEPPI|nr:hypothetical protein NPIL_302601 [Nephila pilipes]
MDSSVWTTAKTTSTVTAQAIPGILPPDIAANVMYRQYLQAHTEESPNFYTVGKQYKKLETQFNIWIIHLAIGSIVGYNLLKPGKSNSKSIPTASV